MPEVVEKLSSEFEAAISLYGTYSPQTGRDRPFLCAYCNRSYRKLSGLIGHHQSAHYTAASTYHLENFHGNGSVVDGIGRKPRQRQRADHGDDDGARRIYTCPHAGCGKRYKTVNGLAYHLKHGKFTGHTHTQQDRAREDAMLAQLGTSTSAAAGLGSDDDEDATQDEMEQDEADDSAQQQAQQQAQAEMHVEVPVQASGDQPAAHGAQGRASRSKTRGRRQERRRSDAG
nr:hypothetical protein HK105_001660 [Polyrhizophydium stewartii]